MRPTLLGKNLHVLLTLLSTRDKTAEFANSVDLYEVAHYEPPHLDLHCLPASIIILSMI